jgi:hypothetical protein
MVRPVVVIDRIQWVSGWFDVFDKPDFFATVTVTGADGMQFSCGSTPVAENRLDQQPNTQLCDETVVVLEPCPSTSRTRTAPGGRPLRTCANLRTSPGARVALA